jgi:3-hydroxybutyryl-CoA dehydratase
MEITRYFEDLQIGEVRVTDGRDVDESDLQRFAELTGDWNRLHMSDETDAASLYGRRIAHGALIFSISLGLVSSALKEDELLALCGVDGLRFLKPVFIGDTIYVRQRVEAKDEKDQAGGFVTFSHQVIDQHGSLALIYSIQTLYARRKSHRLCESDI